jgi:hypothetical protein
MRKFSVELLASTVLAMTTLTPSFASPTVRSVAPPPPAISGYEHRRPAPRATLPAVVPTPQPRNDTVDSPPQERTQDRAQDRSRERVQERAPERLPDRVQERPIEPAKAAEKANAEAPAAPEQAAESKGFDLKASLDKLLAANDSQISEKLRGLATVKHFDKLTPHAPERSGA